jgi:hypothetical protein
MTRLAILMSTLVLVLVATSSVHAQRRQPGHLNRGTISPYLGLVSPTNRGMNSYFSYVRPIQQLDRVTRAQSQSAFAQQYNSQRQTAEFEQTVVNALRQNSQAGGGTGLQQRQSAGAGQRRPAGTFMNTSSYFPRAGANFGTR